MEIVQGSCVLCSGMAPAILYVASLPSLAPLSRASQDHPPWPQWSLFQGPSPCAALVLNSPSIAETGRSHFTRTYGNLGSNKRENIKKTCLELPPILLHSEPSSWAFCASKFKSNWQKLPKGVMQILIAVPGAAPPHSMYSGAPYSLKGNLTLLTGLQSSSVLTQQDNHE